MASKSVNRLDDKTEMYQLTEKQKAVVNTLAEHPDKGPTEIANLASESLDDDTVSRSYVHPIKEKYGHLVEQQREIRDNTRTEGTETTEGDPFKHLDETLGDNSKPYQTIQERPYNGESESKPEEQPTLQADLRRADVEALLSGDVPEDFRRVLLRRIVEQAFEN